MPGAVRHTPGLMEQNLQSECPPNSTAFISAVRHHAASTGPIPPVFGTQPALRKSAGEQEQSVTWRFRQPLGPDCGLLLGLVALLAVSSNGRAHAAEASEYELKAAFLYHFAQLVDWPPQAFAEANSPMIIGVIGENPFGKQLEESVRAKNINGHPLAIKEVQTPAECSTCHILFISASEKKRLSEILSAVRGKNVLTVGETDYFTETGGMINFTLEGTKIRFQINNAAAKAAGLKISSKLLNLATNKTP